MANDLSAKRAYGLAARAKPVYDAALTAIAAAVGLDTASGDLKLAPLKGTKEKCVVGGKLVRSVTRLKEKAWPAELEALQKRGEVVVARCAMME